MEPEKIKKGEKELFIIEAGKKVTIRWLGMYLLVSIIFLFLRILLKGLGSNPETLLVGFIYFISNIFLLPYWGIFPQARDGAIAGQATFDFPALIAIFCNIVLILLAMCVVWIGSNILKTGKQVDETIQKDNPVDPTEVSQEVR